ncbi:MAG: hypothetical protein WBL95_10975 [Microcoleus sp.]
MKFGNGFCNGCNGCNGCKSEGSSATDSLSSDVTVDRRRKKKDFPHSQFPIPNLKSKISNQYELFC